ncbi:WD40 repeat domain-containing protein [Streptomyces sp. N50]|uniref:WD40 repeat domain-containing protein n=1 Tax=Streptomyces sp. N50 TaxID=3081765 RepID=UPI0029621014|nr:WD40 repeat domain-containing protein [Streptomyces sp. N50]WOX12555.1 WD40 repeat domain-containing protein [Streptomyces sp. N50]
MIWSIAPSENLPVPLRIDGGSLGAAFALGLRELFRRPISRRPNHASFVSAVFGLRRKAAVTGALDGSERLKHVEGLDAKLRAARKKDVRLIVPEADNQGLKDLPDFAQVKFAATLKEADHYARQWRYGRLAAAALLVAGVLVPLYISHSDNAEASQRSTATKLASVSGNLLNSHTGLAQLFAARAYREDPTPQTRAALFKAVTASPHLTRSLQASGTVSAAAASGDGRTAFAGTEEGSVVAWKLSADLVEGRRQTALTLKHAVKMIASSADGTTVAAIDKSSAVFRTHGTDPVAIRIPAGQEPTAVAVSPSGRFVAVSTNIKDYMAPPVLLLHDRTTGKTRSVLLKRLSIAPSSIAIPDDGQLVVFDGSYGTWERRSLPNLVQGDGSTVGFGVHDYGSALSADGRYFTYTNADTELPLWRTSGSPGLDGATLTARTKGHNPVALALSADGSRVAQAVNTTVYVAGSVPEGRTAPAPTELAGAGPVNAGTLAFLGTGSDRLVSASGDLLTIWDLSQVSRIGAASSAVIPVSCDACPGPSLSIRPDGQYVAVVDGNGVSLDVQKLGADVRHRLVEQSDTMNAYTYAPPLWTADGKKIVLVSAADDSAQIRSLAPGLPVVGSWPPVPYDPLRFTDPVAMIRLAPDNRRAVQVNSSGTVEVRDVQTGRILRKINGPTDLAQTDGGPVLLGQSDVSIDAAFAHVAVHDASNNAVYVTDLASGRLRAVPGVGKTTAVAYMKNRLLIRRADDTLDVRSADGTRRITTLQGVTDPAYGPVVNGRDAIVETETDGTGKLAHYPSGYTLGTLPIPTGYKAESVGLQFSPDGSQLVTATEVSANDLASAAGEIVTWRLEPAAWMDIACSSAGRDITADEWTQYMDSSAPDDLRCPA